MPIFTYLEAQKFTPEALELLEPIILGKGSDVLILGYALMKLEM
jgi:hypothetical protein